jgi:hypothetical protein
MRKRFDCVEFQHEAGEAVMRKLEGMTDEERQAYWAEQERKFRELQARARAKRALHPTATP